MLCVEPPLSHPGVDIHSSLLRISTRTSMLSGITVVLQSCGKDALNDLYSVSVCVGVTESVIYLGIMLC